MRIPDAVVFDLGDTLVRPPRADLAAGTAAVLALARDPGDVGVEDVLACGRRLIPLDRLRRRIRESHLEFPTACFQRVVHERLGLTFDASPLELEQAFWDGAYGSMPATPGIERFLDVLHDRGIRTAVVSNASFRGETLERELGVGGD